MVRTFLDPFPSPSNQATKQSHLADLPWFGMASQSLHLSLFGHGAQETAAAWFGSVHGVEAAPSGFHGVQPGLVGPGGFVGHVVPAAASWVPAPKGVPAAPSIGACPAGSGLRKACGKNETVDEPSADASLLHSSS
ncbi:hypothetical protein EJB05_23855, partial [Eragrostis curvula]